MAQIMLRDYLQEIEDALGEKRTQDALTKCQYVLDHFPESLEVQRLLGEVHLAQGRLDDAQHAFDWVLTNDPENVIAYCNRALISERLSDFDTALDCYQQAYELSRGNSQIREEFNKISARAGQQGFMFSRAGLARLYMRGDLLSQAVQEWEAVLTVTPDRLDARTGLLETYWREGAYEQVEQLAKQVLEDVPGCMKALLLLAYVTSAKDMQEAREIVQRAEVLDPDLLMAQELFSDLMAGQPGNPFLKLLKKAPTTLESLNGEIVSAAPVSRDGAVQAVPDQAALSADVLANWSDLDDWNGIDTLKPVKKEAPVQEVVSFNAHSDERTPSKDTWGMPEKQQEPVASNTWTGDATPVQDTWGVPQKQQDVRPMQEAASFNAWSGDSTPNMDAWRALDKLQETPTNPGVPVQPAQNMEPAETWEALDRIMQAGNQQGFQFGAWPVPQSDAGEIGSTSNADQALLDAQGWNNANTFAEPGFGEIEAWGSVGDADAPNSAEPWMSNVTHDDALPSPPAWLNMLTQAERRQLSDAAPVLPSVPDLQSAPVAPWEVQSSAVSMSNAPTVKKEEPAIANIAPVKREEPPVVNVPPVKQEEPKEALPALDDEDMFSFGPEWLKSLGAAEMEAAEEPASPPAVSLPAVEPEAQPVVDAPVASVPVEAAQYNEQNMLATLESLEQDLRLQGFIPLEPNSLSAIAQDQAAISSPESTSVQLPEEIQVEESYDEAALSSALAQLSNRAPMVEPPATPAVPDEYTQQAPAEPFEEPSWLAALRAVPAPEPFSLPTPLWEPAPAAQWGVPDEPVYTPPASAQWELPAEPVYNPLPAAHVPQEPVTRVEPFPGPVFNPTPAPVVNPAPMRVSAARGELPVENELEATMKRPAIRLQALQQQPVELQEPATFVQKGRAGTNKAADSTLSYRERLLKGYQHQLVGDYDEAMQEYRVIIRSAPELLVEVISNVRALLKVAPKYSAGYRVLGDAYMRQGEYLQAMEAYNKALTMAKKAKN